MNALRKALLAIVIFTASCSESDRRYTGAGSDLYTSETSSATKDLLNYFGELCTQSGGEPDASGTCKSKNSTPITYTTFVQTGFNDIDRRCDQYIGWIDRKRIEALTFKSSLSATQGLLSAALIPPNVSGETLAYVMAAFSFASNIYDAQNISLLAALESSTIKTLVYKRQRAFRKAAGGQAFSTRASAVFALRNYLLICTPQTIVLDANTFSRDPEAGSERKLQEQFSEQFSTFAPPAPQTSGTRVGQRSTVVAPDPAKCPTCSKVFSDKPGNKGTLDIQIAQRALCMPDNQVDGIGGATTSAAIEIYESQKYGTSRAVNTTESDALLSTTEFNDLQDSGCREGDRKIYRNYFERTSYKDKPVALKGLIDMLNLLYGSDAAIPEGVGMDNSVLRTKLKTAAASLNENPPAPTGQLTAPLLAQIQDAAESAAAEAASSATNDTIQTEDDASDENE